MAQRLFLAIWLPDEASRHLAAAVGPLRAASPPWMRWQPQERWHITVCFLGDLEDDAAGAVRRVAAGAAASAVAEPIRCSGSGRFGPVLWVGVQTGDWLQRLARRLNRELVRHDHRRRFHGHVTVARSRARSAQVHPGSRAALAGYAGPAWQPRELALVVSHLGPSPAYTTVATWVLPAADAAGA
jgi:2'-5' RNA ligase